MPKENQELNFVLTYPLMTNTGMKKKILVIDDEINIAETLADILELKGFEVKTAPDGKAGFSMAVNEVPDLILCDVMMPGMSGYEVLTAVRQNQKTMQVPFLFLSANNHRLDFRQGMDLGADDYLTKPVEIDKLFHAIENRLNKYARLLETGQTEENKRINKELHDTLQQTLLGLQMKLSRFREKNVGFIDVTEIDESLDYIKLAFSQFRMILEYGSSFLQEDIEFAAGLEQMINRVSRYVNFEISVHNELQREIPKEKANVLFKVLIEVLNNAIKHSQANKVFIHLTAEGSKISLVILDDGCGFDLENTSHGSGLKNIRERIDELDGELHIDSAIGNGTTIEILFECI